MLETKDIYKIIEERFRQHEGVANARFDRLESLLERGYVPLSLWKEANRSTEKEIKRIEDKIDSVKRQSSRDAEAVNKRLDEFGREQKQYVNKLVTALTLIMTAIGAAIGVMF